MILISVQLVIDLSIKMCKLTFCRINLLFLNICVKSKPEELQGHKVVPVMSHKFDLVLSSL